MLKASSAQLSTNAPIFNEAANITPLSLTTEHPVQACPPQDNLQHQFWYLETLGWPSSLAAWTMCSAQQPLWWGWKFPLEWLKEKTKQKTRLQSAASFFHLLFSMWPYPLSLVPALNRDCSPDVISVHVDKQTCEKEMSTYIYMSENFTNLYIWPSLCTSLHEPNNTPHAAFFLHSFTFHMPWTKSPHSNYQLTRPAGVTTLWFSMQNIIQQNSGMDSPPQ